MNALSSNHSITFENTERQCPIGEKTGEQMICQGNIPVISCEGSCIRGEIARVAANMLAKTEGYGRGCHGEIISVPQSAMAKWAGQAEKIVVIDGCFLHCHGRILKGLFDEDKLAIFDALSYYGKYTDIMDIDDVPEPERKEAAQLVMTNVRGALDGDSPCSQNKTAGTASCGQDNSNATPCCGAAKEETSGCCGS
jgi:uncharacterized metal-binding protein